VDMLGTGKCMSMAMLAIESGLGRGMRRMMNHYLACTSLTGSGRLPGAHRSFTSPAFSNAGAAARILHVLLSGNQDADVRRLFQIYAFVRIAHASSSIPFSHDGATPYGRNPPD
jgi:hypothetical protein